MSTTSTQIPQLDAGIRRADLEQQSGSRVASWRRWSWVGRRIGVGIVTLFAISLLVFAATQLLPSDPARAILGREATPERLAVLRADLGLNHSAVHQYIHWLANVLTGDFGRSLANGEPVTSYLSSRIANSLVLVVLSAGVAIPLSFLLGGLAASRRDGVFDNIYLTVAQVVTSLPEFVIGMVLIVLFGTVVFPVLPAVSLIPPGQSPLDDPAVLVLPVATLVLAVVPYLSRVVRATMIDVQESDYVRMARMKGLSPRRVTIVHVLPNVLVPATQVIAVMLAFLAGGVVVIEFLFDYPGLGQALTEAVAARDVPVVQAATLFLAAVYVVVNLAADIITVLVTPRLRTGDR